MAKMINFSDYLFSKEREEAAYSYENPNPGDIDFYDEELDDYDWELEKAYLDDELDTFNAPDDVPNHFGELDAFCKALNSLDEWDREAAARLIAAKLRDDTEEAHWAMSNILNNDPDGTGPSAEIIYDCLKMADKLRGK